MNPLTIELIAQLLASATGLLTEYLAAQSAGDQASLDAIHARVVAQSDAMAPSGAVVVPVSLT